MALGGLDGFSELGPGVFASRFDLNKFLRHLIISFQEVSNNEALVIQAQTAAALLLGGDPVIRDVLQGVVYKNRIRLEGKSRQEWVL